MITHQIGNLLEAPDVDALLQQCNIYHTMGAGIALAIKRKFPEAYEADCQTVKGDESKLGTFSVGEIKQPKTRLKYVINLYSQADFGGSNRQTSYDAMVAGLEKVEEWLISKKCEKIFTLGIPYRMGAGLANGDWRIIRAIIESVFADSSINVVIYYLPEFAGECPKSDDSSLLGF